MGFKRFRFPLLEKQGPQVRLVLDQKPNPQQGIGLGSPGGVLQGKVEVLKQVVGPLAVDEDSLPQA
jgi:hypothetical protein